MLETSQTAKLSPAENASAAKSALRQRLMVMRAKAHFTAEVSSARLCALALPLLLEISKPGTVIAGYWPMQTEIDPRPLLHGLSNKSRDIALPVVLGPDQPLSFRAWAAGDVTTNGVLGTTVPQPQARILIPDIVLSPMVGFDRRRNRLGYGGGYYDRTLQALRVLKPILAFGIAFSAQEVDELPIDPWDQPLDLILTENGVI